MRRWTRRAAEDGRKFPGAPEKEWASINLATEKSKAIVSTVNRENLRVG
jgi:hypothetical protein